MFKNKYVKILIVVFCIIFVIMSVETAIMAGNVLHTEQCHNENCQICNLIQIATDFIRNIELIIFDILIFIAIIPLVPIMEKSIKQAKKLTLVELKVIQLK